MNCHNLALIILLAPIFIFADETPEKFTQCPNTDRIEKQLEKVTQTMLEQQKYITALIAFMQSREAKDAQLIQLRQQQAALEQEELEQVYAWYESLPSWKKYCVRIISVVQPFVTEQLWPSIKSQLTYMIARKLLEEGLNATDFCTGTLPEKAGIPIVAFRFGEWVSLNSEQRKNNNNVRLCNKNPEYRVLKKDFETFNKQNFIEIHMLDLKQKRTEQIVLGEKIENERRANEDRKKEMDALAADYPNQTARQRSEREQKHVRDQEVQAARSRLEHEKTRAQIKKLREEKEAQEARRELEQLRSSLTIVSDPSEID